MKKRHIAVIIVAIGFISYLFFRPEARQKRLIRRANKLCEKARENEQP
jgi:hypothetical protein